MKWRISGPARRDLESVWEFTATNWGIEQADRYVDSLTTRIIWLANNRALWRSRDDVRDGLFSYTEGRHLIFFEATDNLLSVVRVLHERMDVVQYL